MTKTVFQLDSQGYFAGIVTADESPLEPGVYHYPAGSVEAAPPTVGEGLVPRYVDGAWTAEALPESPPPPPPHVPTKDERVASILAVIPGLTRREVQAIIAIAELNAKLELAINGTPIADSLASALASNSSYRTARYLEDQCRVVDKS